MGWIGFPVFFYCQRRAGFWQRQNKALEYRTVMLTRLVSASTRILSLTAAFRTRQMSQKGLFGKDRAEAGEGYAPSSRGGLKCTVVFSMEWLLRR